MPTSGSSGTLEASDDIDVFSFSVTADHVYIFSATSRLYLQLRVKNLSGLVLASSTSNAVSFKATTPGTVFAEVLAYSSYGASGAYTYSVVDLGLDDHGDTLATATALSGLGAWTTGKLEYGADVDFFSISLAANATHQVSTSGAYLYVTVFSPGGVTYTAESSTALPFTTSAAGTYYVRVRYPYGSGSTTYQVRVQ